MKFKLNCSSPFAGALHAAKYNHSSSSRVRNIMSKLSEAT